MMCGDGARSWDSGRRADVVGGPWDASLVVPGVERRPRRGPDAVAASCVARHAVEATSVRRRGGGGSQHGHAIAEKGRRAPDSPFDFHTGPAPSPLA